MDRVCVLIKANTLDLPFFDYCQC